MAVDRVTPRITEDVQSRYLKGFLEADGVLYPQYGQISRDGKPVGPLDPLSVALSSEDHGLLTRIEQQLTYIERHLSEISGLKFEGSE